MNLRKTTALILATGLLSAAGITQAQKDEAWADAKARYAGSEAAQNQPGARPSVVTMTAAQVTPVRLSKVHGEHLIEESAAYYGAVRVVNTFAGDGSFRVSAGGKVLVSDIGLGGHTEYLRVPTGDLDITVTYQEKQRVVSTSITPDGYTLLISGRAGDENGGFFAEIHKDLSPITKDTVGAVRFINVNVPTSEFGLAIDGEAGDLPLVGNASRYKQYPVGQLGLDLQSVHTRTAAASADLYVKSRAMVSVIAYAKEEVTDPQTQRTGYVFGFEILPDSLDPEQRVKMYRNYGAENIKVLDRPRRYEAPKAGN